ncbi:ketopantoate reductase family protein [Maribellus maritimus]|uniref:ketopantoate reductase family protein n=1 Tax=Maribellus maritimus TaxID=2870838 RepID=UPI001EEA3B93|nr:2-dehydropantoate 2-reductase [Maribellus maritimus]MCG6186919.1 2-dehydropantoate 2-reductase [Maribellus maritimus]
MKKDKIYIVGAGAIGQALAVFLQQEKRDVILVRGSVDNKPAKENIITVTNQDNQKFQQKITTTTFGNLKDINGIVLVTAKAFANVEIAQKLKNKGDNFSVVILQNGLNIEKPFADFENVFRCVLFSTSQRTSNNTVSFKMVTDSPVGDMQGKNANLNAIVNQISTPHFCFKNEPNILNVVWEKVIINCAFNSICPLLETDNGIFLRNREATKLAKTIIAECIEVANKCGITLNQKEIEEKLLLISRRADGQLISTYEDIRNNRRTEIESLNLEISRLADKMGMLELVPNTRLLGEMIQLKSKIGMANINH